MKQEHCNLVLSYNQMLTNADFFVGTVRSAAQPLHWVYDLQKLSMLLSQSPEAEFRPESANPFYRRNTGQQSCYGDQAFVLLESLSECEGEKYIPVCKNMKGETVCLKI